MDANLYKLIFDGKIKEGEDLSQVKVRLAALFRVDAARIEHLFNNSPSVIKRGLNKQEALKYKQAVEKTGALCRVEQENIQPEISPKSAKAVSIQKKASSDKKTIYQAKIAHQEVGFYKYVVWPIVRIKNAFEAVFDTILGMIWSELMGEKQVYSQTAQLIAFLIFSVASFVIYRLPDYVGDLLIWIFVAIWLFDRFLSKHAHFQTEKYEQISLKMGKEQQFIWRKTDLNGETYKVDFERNSLIQISITRENLPGGAFQGIIGSVWKLYLTLDDGVDLLIDAQKKVIPAIKKAKKLAGYFDVPVKFTDSEGESALAVDASRVGNATVSMKQNCFSPGAIKLKKTTNGFHVYSTWNKRSVLLFLGNVLKRSGFLLFLVIMDGVMFRYGKLLNWLIGPYLGLHDTTLYLNISFSGVLSIFKPEDGWLDIIGIAFAVAIMLYHGWKMSRRRCVSIDSKKTTFFIGKKPIAELKTDEIELPIFIAIPQPLVLIVDHNNAIAISNLQTDREYRALASGIGEGIKEFKNH